ncbi:hypothetical protein Hanom_Chr07g00637661 [Helianthus anomalus]
MKMTDRVSSVSHSQLSAEGSGVTVEGLLLSQKRLIQLLLLTHK